MPKIHKDHTLLELCLVKKKEEEERRKNERNRNFKFGFLNLVKRYSGTFRVDLVLE